MADDASYLKILSTSPEDFQSDWEQRALKHFSQAKGGARLGREEDGSPYLEVGESRRKLTAEDLGLRQKMETYARGKAKLLKNLTENLEPLPLLDRAKRGIKYEGGELGYLEETYGKENVVPVRGSEGAIDNFVVLQGGKPRWVAESSTIGHKEGFKGAVREVVGDVADVSGEILESLAYGVFAPPLIKAGAAGGAAAGTVLAGPEGGAVGGVVGALGGAAGAGALASGGRQALSSALPGEDFATKEDRLKEIGVGALSGLGGEAIGQVVRPVLSTARASWTAGAGVVKQAKPVKLFYKNLPQILTTAAVGSVSPGAGAATGGAFALYKALGVGKNVVRALKDPKLAARVMLAFKSAQQNKNLEFVTRVAGELAADTEYVREGAKTVFEALKTGAAKELERIPLPPTGEPEVETIPLEIP